VVLKPPAGLDVKLLPGRHPAVTKKLHSMDQELRSLESSKHNAVHVRENLEDEVKQAFKHLDSVVSIKSQLAKTEVQIVAEERKLRKLEDDRFRLDRTHKSLSASLHHVMGPKIEFARARLSKRKRQLVELQDLEAKWKTKEDEYHASSLTMLDERRKSKDSLDAALIKEQLAHQERKSAEKHLVEVKRGVAKNIEAYRYSKAIEKASTSKEKHGEDSRKQAEVSVKRLEQILSMEQRRVDESMAIGKDRVNGQIQKLKGSEEDSKEDLAKLRLKYRKWQETQQALASQLASSQHGSSTAAKDFVDMQDKMLTSAQDQVVSEAVSDSDWTGWDEWPGAEDDRSIP
jgi:hypothetical protein